MALGRFGAAGSPQEGILDPATADLSTALPHGLLFLDTTLAAAEDGDLRDSLGHPAAAPLLTAWAEHRGAIDTKRSLREWLATDFFKDVHKGMYENRPIHWPLSSANKTFVAWVNIHRMNDQTLRALLADHLLPTQARMDGELNDLRAARDGADKKAAQAAEKQYSKLLKAREELVQFMASVTQCADRGAPPTDPKCPAARAGPALRPQPRRRRDDQQRRAVAAARAAVEGPEEVVEGAERPERAQGLRLGPPRAPLLAHARGREVPGGPLARRRPRLLLAVPPRARLGLGAAPAGRDRARLPH
ncbi:MAG: hypothetical protein IPI43_29715 [Sandaracinaceae bacterium]|nr:hypothetical protein [Sandaracinaceae bacterium]